MVKNHQGRQNRTRVRFNNKTSPQPKTVFSGLSRRGAQANFKFIPVLLKLRVTVEQVPATCDLSVKQVK